MIQPELKSPRPAMSIKTGVEQSAHTEGRDIAPEEIQIQELFQM